MPKKNGQRTSSPRTTFSLGGLLADIGAMLRRLMYGRGWDVALVGHTAGAHTNQSLQFIGGREPWDRESDPFTTVLHAQGAKSYQGISILIVEDNPGDVLLIREMLTGTEYAFADVHYADSLKTAREAPLDRASVALVLLDLGLPESRGMDTLLAIKELYPDSAIIVLTGLEDAELSVQALREGAQNYLTKDEIDASRLGMTLRFAIERHQFIQRLRQADKELIERERRFHAITEHGNDLLTIRDAQGKMLYESPAKKKLLGYADDGTAMPTGFDLIHPDDIPGVSALFEASLRTPGVPLEHSGRFIRKDGSIVHVKGYMTNLLHVPEVQGVVSNIHDVTEAVLLQEKLAFDRSNLSAMINSTQDLIWSVDRELRLISANDAFADTIEKLVGIRLKPGDSVMIPDIAGASPTAHWRKHYERAFAGESFTVEEHVSDPRESFTMLNLGPLRDGNRIVGAAVFSRDITHTRLAEKELERIYLDVRASELQKASILDSISANIALLDTHGNIVAVNAKWRAFANDNGYSHGNNGLGCNYVDIARRSIGSEAAMGVEAAEGIRQVLMGQLPLFSMEYPCDSHSEKRWFRMRVSPLSHTADQGAVVIHMDITDIRQANEELERWNTHLEDRVVERTSELLLVNEELEAETEKNKRLAREVAARTSELMASINYASGIQRSLLPGKDQFDHFKDMGLVYRPRDVVGGDFLWCHNTEEHIIVAVADCTGHGVPGAMLSMVGHDLLNNIVPRNDHLGPSDILRELDSGVKRLFLRTEGLNISDGMDMAIAKLDKTTLQLRTSGAGLPVLVIRDGERTLLPASKVPLGGNHVAGCKLFNEFTYQLLPGDRLCMFTDGYADQFGGPAGKKLFRRVFFELLCELQTLPASEAANTLAQHFVEWKGDLDQVDDVLVLLLDV